MAIYSLQSVYLPQGWTRDAEVTVSPQGFITGIAAGVAPRAGGGGIETDVERVVGVVIPGMPNAHSHAFQRAMAGSTEYRSSGRDSFWTWRQSMYALANRITAEQLEIVASQLFVEMLKAGYTSVAEFHYLHRDTGAAHAGSNGLWDAIDSAARTAGIGLTFLPTLYQSSDFGGAQLKPEQARFALSTDRFLRTVEDRIVADRRSGTTTARTGAAFHSLRAVPLDQLRDAAAALRAMDPEMPVHIHAAEQLAEVEACRQATGRRPLELLLEQNVLTPHWCLVHATHATASELRGVAQSGALVCVSVSTEANLGDGLFNAAGFLGSKGRLCIGSDSQATVNPAEELRWLEYQQRLRKKRRNVLSTKKESHVGTRLWSDAALHGADAIGQPVGAIAVGRRADWLVLDVSHPAMAGAATDTALDRLLFAGADRAIRGVMVGGRWVIKDHRHDADTHLPQRFLRVMQNLRAA